MDSCLLYKKHRFIRWSLALALGIVWLNTGHSAADDSLDSSQIARRLSHAFRTAAEKAMPSVVTIITKTAVEEGRELTREDFPFELPPDFELPPGLRLLPDGLPSRGVGSGIVIRDDGVILTNNHVVEHADEVWVRFADGSEFEAYDIRADEKSDLAVFRVRADKSFNAAILGDSDQLGIGDWVLAIGSPFELDTTVSAGIISGKGRGVRKIKRGKLIQTDAAINPGNSGGPLVNLKGEVVGINTAIASTSGAYAGIGFAIPVNRAQWVTRQLLDTGQVRRAYLGISINTIDSEYVREHDLDTTITRGALVQRVYAGTPAAVAGIEKSDVIISFAGNLVRDAGDLQDAVEGLPFDTTHQVRVNRAGTIKELDVVLIPVPQETLLEPTAPEDND